MFLLTQLKIEPTADKTILEGALHSAVRTQTSTSTKQQNNQKPCRVVAFQTQTAEGCIHINNYYYICMIILIT